MNVAIVTGASQGIGAGIAAAFRGAGYGVVATARSIQPSDDHDLLTVAGDIADAATADLVVQQTLDRFGRIDTLVNNAGIFIGKHFTDYTADDLAAMLAVNLAGFFHLTRACSARCSSRAAATSSTSRRASSTMPGPRRRPAWPP